MGEGLLQPMHLVVILFIALIVFGPKKLPELGKGLGEAIRGFKDSIKAADAPPGPAAETKAPQENNSPAGKAD